MGITLLLADDSITIQKVVGIIFANEDYELVVVDNGNSALEKARETKPDIMLVDALMPGKNGYEVCEEVRQDPALKNIPLLLLVGAFEPFDEDKARASGADDHITKPFESQSLIDKVKTLVELAASRAAEAPAVSQVAPEPEFVELSEPPAVEPPDVAFAAAEVKEEFSESEPLEFPEIAAEISEAAVITDVPEEPSAAVPASEARLFDSFRDFVHLGSGAAPAAEPEESLESIEESSNEVSPAPGEPEGVVLLSTVDIVEASPEDDPWGTFSEVVEEGAAIQFGEVLDTVEGETLDSSATIEEIEPFAILNEESPAGVISAVLPQEESAVADADETSLADEFSFTEDFEPQEQVDENASPDSLGGESISLGDFSPVFGAETAFEPAPFMSPEEEPAPVFTAEEEQSEPLGFSPDEGDLPFAAEEDYVSAGQLAEPCEEPSAPFASSSAAEVVTLSEEQLASAISRVSREIIEKIAWEVVPDLAEAIIKEEIRKIKEGLGR